MLNMIKGITVLLHVKTDTGEKDPFGKAIYADHSVPVENVLVSPVTDTDAVEQLNLNGKKSVYTLHIPKGDQHTWTDTEVDFYGEKWRTFGAVTKWEECMVPSAISWASSIQVERYE